jgi:hypothetical protein
MGAKLSAMLVVDAANVIGSRPTGWWRDRAGAARTFTTRVRRATLDRSLAGPVVVVLEGKAREGVEEGVADEVEVVHAPGEGDDTIVDIAGVAAAGQAKVTVVTADRGLAERVRARGAEVVGPTWLLDRLPEETGCSGVESAGP